MQMDTDNDDEDDTDNLQMDTDDCCQDDINLHFQLAGDGLLQKKLNV